tara:strand:+ start:3189 stop:3701 length:513 start_codon:yes stop_codon:yes gene_type:complete
LEKLRVLDLFSGIGGISHGLHMTGGFETAAFIEIEPYCQKVLSKRFPDIPLYSDIKEFHYAEERKNIGSVNVIAGGFPCQPWSVAGKKGGTKDDRDLWPEMLRIIKDIKPRWVIGENVQGFVNMELGLARTVTNLENENFTVRTFTYGAVGLQAPHQRQRCIIVANSKSD